MADETNQMPPSPPMTHEELAEAQRLLERDDLSDETKRLIRADLFPVAMKSETTHGSPELDEDAAKLIALGADPGPAFVVIACSCCGGDGTARTNRCL